MHTLYEQFISVFEAPAKLLSDHGTNFTSALVEELCSAFGIQKCRTTAYHAQCNGQMERFHQMLFQMIGKLATDKKTQWEQHLPELLQAYNSTRSAVMWYSPHYLMFRRATSPPCRLFLPHNRHEYKSPSCPCLCGRGTKCFKEAYAEAQQPVQQRSRQTEVQL